MFLMRRHLVTYYIYQINCKGSRCCFVFVSFSFSLSPSFNLLLPLTLFLSLSHTLSLTPSLSFTLTHRHSPGSWTVSRSWEDCHVKTTTRFPKPSVGNFFSIPSCRCDCCSSGEDWMGQIHKWTEDIEWRRVRVRMIDKECLKLCEIGGEWARWQFYGSYFGSR